MVSKKEKEKVLILDGTNDRKYFTMVPNYILNHSTADEQALYLQMKRFAGEEGECFASQGVIGEKLGWNRQRVGRTIQKLLKRKWIVKAGVHRTEISGGLLTTDVYKMVDLWKENVDFYSKETIVKRDTNSMKTIVKRDNTTIVNGVNTKKNPLEEKPVSVRAKKVRKDTEIIKLYSLFTGEPLKFKRFVRAAKRLAEYPIERIKEVMSWLDKNADFKWTLETVEKYIDRNLDKLRTKRRELTDEEKLFVGRVSEWASFNGEGDKDKVERIVGSWIRKYGLVTVEAIQMRCGQRNRGYSLFLTAMGKLKEGANV